MHPELLLAPAHQAVFWAEFGRALAVEKRTWGQGVRLLQRVER